MTPTQKQKVRAAIAAFCVQAERSRLNWTYAEVRPFHGFGEPATVRHVADCSAYVSLAFNWAMHVTGIYLPDPLDERYSGWGYTGTMLNYLRHNTPPPGRYLIGDMAIFGTPSNTVHTAICRQAGNDTSAIFSSNGRGSTVFNQDAPEPVTLAAAMSSQQLVGVYRHPSLA